MDLHQVYRWVAVCILMAAFFAFLHATRLIFFNHKENFQNPVILAMYLLVPPNMIMVFGYLSEHLYELYANSIAKEGAMCTLIGFCATAAIVAIMGGAIVLAYASERLIHLRNRTTLKKILLGNAFFWILGVVLASQFFFEGALGPYQGLYCCISSSSFGNISVLFTMIFLTVSFVCQIFLYRRAYLSMKASDANISELSSKSGNGIKNTEATTLVRESMLPIHAGQNPYKKSSQQLLQWGLEMVISFALCWSLIFCHAAYLWFTGEAIFILDILAAWFVKISPLIHCILLSWRIGQFKKVGFDQVSQEPSQHVSLFGNSKFLKTDSLAQLDKAREKKHRLRDKLRGTSSRRNHSRQAALHMPGPVSGPYRQQFIISAVELT
mmetsp:Transcript_17653/g.22258  ORF Transcript_17653/g.22258 Transcript_17653/m.22258 type:complete len:382 (+) Transcript_17653:67-1212(+)